MGSLVESTAVRTKEAEKETKHFASFMTLLYLDTYTVITTLSTTLLLKCE